jgi:hypothetical protein
MITLEGCDVCPVAWYTIMDVSRATYYQWKVNASSRMRADQHGNVGTTKPRIHMLQATATLRQMLEQSVDHMFVGGGSSPLFQALLTRAGMCEGSLPPPPGSPVEAATLPPVLNMQLDNACSDNKNRYVFSFFSLLVHKGVFREVYVNFLLVGHTHEDIDAMFGRWSRRLRENDYPTLPMLMKSFMDVETEPVIPHLIEEVLISKHLLMVTFVVAMTHYRGIQMRNNSSSTKMTTAGH